MPTWRVRAAKAPRTEAFDGRALLGGEEAERPYDRPRLPKDYLPVNDLS